jgi:NAD-dependent histone deacetylase SIR2
LGQTGAGISTSAGIPDFRSPDTGLYANLARLNLPFAEAVFDISYFRNNPLPFYTLAHELYPGRYKPTIAHSFIKLLHDKGRLLKLFTQNIDCLEREAGVPGDMIVEAHGSFATQRCIDCGTEFPDDLMKKIVMAREVPRCLRKTCNGLVKPDIVFFGEALPEAFHRNRSLPTQADLAIVMGTSLTVQPFASLPSFVREETPRILINLERVGGLGGRADDVLLLGDCDAGVRKLADALGWRDELESLWEKTVSSKAAREDQSVPPKTRDEKLEDEVEKLTRDIEKSLKVSEEHTAWLKDHLSKKHNLQKRSEDDKAAATLALPAESEEASGDTAEAVTNGDAKSSSAPAEAQDQSKGGIAHVYPHLGPKASVPLEKPSL